MLLQKTYLYNLLSEFLITELFLRTNSQRGTYCRKRREAVTAPDTYGPNTVKRAGLQLDSAVGSVRFTKQQLI